MESVKHPSCNHELGKPRDWDDSKGQCDSLPVTLEDINGIPYVSSFWKPSEAELKALNEGALVKLWIVGQGMPPVALSVEK